MEEPRPENTERPDGPDPSSGSRPFWRSWREKVERFMVVGVVIVRKEWELLVDPDASWIRGIRTRDRPPVALPERPVEQSFSDHLLLSSNVRELQRAARRMVEEENWHTALELYTEALRRHERSEGQEVDVTLYHRIGDLHRRLAVEWYVEAADHYTERSLRHGAIALCEKALQLDPGREDARHNLEWLLDRTASRPPAPVDGTRPEPSPPASSEPEPTEPEPPAPEPEEHARPPEPVPTEAESPPTEPESPAPAPEAAPSPRHAAGVGEVFEVEPVPGRRHERFEAPPYREEPDEEADEEREEPGRPVPAEDRRAEHEDPPEPVGETEPAPRADVDPSGMRPEGDTEPLPDRIVLPPPDEEYEQLRRRVRRVVVGAGATLVALIVVVLIAL